jgi:hemerythrin
MTRFIWSPKYELGIDVVDHQHQRIVHYINQLCRFPSTDWNDEEVYEVLNNLVDYTLSHFAFEETLLEDAGYADLAQHQALHGNFTRLIDDIKGRFQRGEAVSNQLAGLLQDWLISHIMTEDKKYVALVKKKLLENPA